MFERKYFALQTSQRAIELEAVEFANTSDSQLRHRHRLFGKSRQIGRDLDGCAATAAPVGMRRKRAKAC